MQTAGMVRGLYAITDATLQPPERLVDAVAAAVDGGARVIQYRDKGDDHARRLEQGLALAALCRDRGATFLVNDDIRLAAESGADGVHLGRDDEALVIARRELGDCAVIGVSCYNEFHRALDAEAAGASYVAFGSVFPSRVKPQAPRAELALLRRARQQLRIPIVAIGGVDADNAGLAVAAGADAVAVISAVFASTDVAAAARRVAAVFE